MNAPALSDTRLRSSFVPLAVGKPPRDTPRGWRWAELKTLARLESGHTPSRRRPEWWGGDVPWVSLADIRKADGAEIFETEETTNALGIANSAARILPPGTVILSRTASVGFAAIMGRSMATSQDFVNWVCGPDLDPRFLMYLLIAARTFLLEQASGAIHKTIYFPTVETFHVCLPSLLEQRRLTAHLDATRAAAARARAAVEASLAGAKALSMAFLREVFESERTRRWPWRTIQDIAPEHGSICDGPFGSKLKSDHYRDTGTRVIRLQNIGLDEFLDSDRVYIDREYALELAGHRFLPGDVLVASLGEGARPAGRACVIPDDTEGGVVKADCFRIRPDRHRIIPNFLSAFLSSPISLYRLADRMRGATRPRLTLGMIKSHRVPSPSIAEQREMLRHLLEHSRLTKTVADTMTNEVDSLRALPMALLRDAFAGRL